jgi:hypothetical protein
MLNIERNNAPESKEIKVFLSNIAFNLPQEFIEFYKQSDGAMINSDELYTSLWSLTAMIQLNLDYNVKEYAPDFFIFGSDGGDTAFAIEKDTGKIFEMPFIGMSREEAVFIANTFDEFLLKR